MFLPLFADVSKSSRATLNGRPDVLSVKLRPGSALFPSSPYYYYALECTAPLKLNPAAIEAIAESAAGEIAHCSQAWCGVRALRCKLLLVTGPAVKGLGDRPVLFSDQRSPLVPNRSHHLAATESVLLSVALSFLVAFIRPLLPLAVVVAV